MKSLMAADSPLQRILGRVADVMILNLLFFVTSLPLITLGASLTALSRTALEMVDDRQDSVPGTYLRAFRQNLRQATILLGIAVAAVAVLLAWLLVVSALDVSPLLVGLAYAVIAVVALRLLVILCFLFPYQATFEGGTREVITAARKMSARHPVAALGMVAVLVLPVVVTVTEPALAGYGLFWLLFGAGAIACVNALLLRSVFSRYIPTETTPDLKETSR
ncbi:hypothetical protein CFK41_01505 [Brachybacterium ginsengisoli]|uniref:Beta-carotene 15,15'-monooxygenase n=1 Tax=Brachybacterium ginsengisoli TaxID=1331682 RepID=A0A291GTS8_9MICO|nr:YesL family protein [Brachybacterium ginsengisoli]ATG53598.1 hypothetical protein CFK41_01505 [Brachybacterium ginsengisoli]